jgi:predicted nucleotidyltransferase
MFMPDINLLPGAVAEILVSATETKVLTLADRYGLKAAILDEYLEQEDEQALNRLLRCVVRGRIKVIGNG